MSSPEYPNKYALIKAHDNYLYGMSIFIKERLTDKAPISDALEAIDIALILRDYQNAFEGYFKTTEDYLQFMNKVWLAVEGRNRASHPPWDLDPEFTQTHLFLIADTLKIVNMLKYQRKVEEIRDNLFSDDTPEKLEEAEKALAEAQESQKALAAENEQLQKALEAAKAEAKSWKKRLDTETKRKKEAQTAKRELTKRCKRLESAEERITAEHEETKAELTKAASDLGETKAELSETASALDETKEKLSKTASELSLTKADADEGNQCLSATLNLLAATTLGKTTYPTCEMDSTVRVLDRRNANKKDYLLDILDSEHPAIIYVQNGQMIDTLFESVVPERTSDIGKYYEESTDADARSVLEKIEKGALKAVVTDRVFASLPSEHPFGNFVFCHPVPRLETFFGQCEPAFTSRHNAYLYLIYNDKELTEKYPDRKKLKRLYEGLKARRCADNGLIQTGNLYSELEFPAVSVETGLTIFEELEFIERYSEGIKFLPPCQRQLEDSTTYCRGETLKAFQLGRSAEEIWEAILEKQQVDRREIIGHCRELD